MWGQVTASGPAVAFVQPSACVAPATAGSEAPGLPLLPAQRGLAPSLVAVTPQRCLLLLLLSCGYKRRVTPRAPPLETVQQPLVPRP